jgi:hypothetical protein
MPLDVSDIGSMHWVDRPASLKQFPQAVRDSSKLRQAQVAIASDRDNDVIEPHAAKGSLARHDLPNRSLNCFVTFMLFLTSYVELAKLYTSLAAFRGGTSSEQHTSPGDL